MLSLRPARLLMIGIFSIAAILTASLTARAQNFITINYGDTVNGEIKAAKPNNSVVYSFSAQADDVITVTMVRTSGNLRPLAILADPSKTGNDLVLTQSTISSDGKTATITEFTLSAAGSYAIVATHEGFDKGTTAGKFTLTLENTASGGNTATDTPVPTRKANATPTKKASSKPTATPTEAPASNSADVQTFSVGTSPSYSVWSGNNLYVANMGDGTVSILDGDGKSTGVIKGVGVPFAMAWDGARLWVADLGATDKPGDSVNVFDAKGKKIGTYKVGAQPFSLSYDPDDKQMWVAVYGDNKIVAVDPKGKIVTTVDVTDAGSNPNTVLWNGTQLWATLAGTEKNVGNTVIAVSTDGSIAGTYTVGKNPADLAWNDTDQILYVANYDDGTVTALDSDGKVVGTYKVGKNPSALAWDGKELWVTLSGDKAVAAVSSKGKVLAKIALNDAPNGVTFDGTSTIWVALQGTNDSPGSSVAKIDISSAVPQ